MSLPKGQHFEYRVIWEGAFGYEKTMECASADDAERLLRYWNETFAIEGATASIERRPVGEWEGP